MRKTRKRVFAAVLAATLLFTMPGMLSAAAAEGTQTEDISESVTVLAEYDVAEKPEAETEVIQEPETEDSDTDKSGTGEDDAGDADAQEPAEEETVLVQKEDVKECTCGTLCTQDSINGDCPVCGAEDADLSRCKGEKTENSSEEKKEDAGQEDAGGQDDSANLCAHHREHTQDCDYSPASEDGEGSTCTYECHICPIEDLIATLPGEVTEGNAEKVRVQLNKILALYRELSEDEQEQIDLTRCYDLQAALDETNAPMTTATGDVVLSESIMSVTFTAGECGDNCQGHIITQGPATMTGCTYIIVESGNHNVTFSSLNITPNALVGVMPGATMNLTLMGSNTIQGDCNGIYVPVGATLIINGSGSLDVSASSAGAGIGGAYYNPSDTSELGNLNCGTVVINGGTITATGGSACAGIGGACGDYDHTTPGNGGNVTINGGTVTATGGGDSGYYGGAGIGGGIYNGKSGSGGTLTIYGGHVTLNVGTLNDQYGVAYGFGRGSGSNSNAGTLTLADASCLTLSSGTTLDPKGTYSINGDPTSDMIVVPTDLEYTGQTHDLTGKIYIDDSKTGTAEYFGQTFNVTASADGWVLQDLGEVVEARDYTVTFTKGGKSISTTFTVAECPHTGLVYESQENNKHGGTCPDCGTEVSEEHTWVDGVCSVCILKAVAKVETSGGTIVYLGEGDFANAFDDRKYNNVTVTLLSDIQADSIEMGDTQASVHVLNTSTLDLAGHTITSSDTAIYVYPTGNLTIQDSSSGKTGQVVSISSAAILTQTGMVSLTGGTYTGIPTIDGKASSTNVSSLLANYGTQTTPHYAYFNAQGNPIALGENQRELTGTVTVKECTHQKALQDQGNGTHGGDCPYCGAELAAAPHTLGDGNKCEGCGAELKVQVKIGNATTYYSDLDAAWTTAYSAQSAEVTLLANVTETLLLGVSDGEQIALNGGSHTLSIVGFSVSGGQLDITGGVFEMPNGLEVLGGTVRLSGGKFISTTGYVVIVCYPGSGLTVDEFLAEGCAYYRNGKPIEMTGQTYLEGTVTVQECHHEGVKATPNNNGTHSLKCPYCGYTETPENCDYGTEYKHDENNHWQICAVCGYQKTETHTLNLKQGDTVNGVTQNREACDCGFFNAFTVTVTVPSGLTYGNTGGKRVAYTVNPVKSGDAEWELTDMQGKVLEMEDDTLPANLPAGDYRLWIYGSNDSKYVFVGTYYLTVSAAPLTGEMVTLSTESVTYSGAEQKPTITVKQGETTLAPGTDYDVAYSTTDFTNAGTIIITITGKGNYKGTVEKTYIIKKAPLTITASNQTITYGGSITQGAGNVTTEGLCTGDVLESITLTASTANAPGGNITPSAAGIKNSGGGDVTGNYEITYKDGGLTINKADAEITVGTNAYNNTFGDAAFTLDVTDNNTEADVQYEVTAGADVVSVSNGTVTIRNAGTATITVSLPETANYNAAASRTITVTVAKKGGYSVTEQNRNYLYSRENTGSIDLAALLPKDCGTITYGTPAASGDVTYSVKPAVNDGKLSYTLNSGNKNDEGTITVTVATRNYTDIAVTVKVKLTDQMPVSLKTGTEVTLENNVLTYGEPLSKLKFNKAEFVDDDGKTVEGILAWKDAAATPNAGTTGATWVFIPTDEAYASVEGTAAITVNKAVPAVSAAPTVAGRVYDPSAALQDSDLKGGTVNVPGTWSWQKAGIIPAVNNSGYEAVFTPEDTTNYEIVPRTITVNVTRATPYIAGLPAAAAITYGEALKDSLLSGGTVQYGSGTGQAGEGAGSTEPVAGAFTWKEPSTKPVVADSNVTEYTVIFTPSDTANYNPVEAKVKLTVNKAQNAPNMPGSAMSVSNSIEKVGSVPLPAGWEWLAKDTALEAGAAVSAVAVYIGADKGNYENETVTVAITREACSHENTELRNVVAATCQEKGYSGDTYCLDCGEILEKGTEINPTDHSGGTATCTSGKVCQVCGTEYTEKNSGNHTHTEIRGAAEAACTADGYTGDTYCTDCNTKTGTGTVIPAAGHTEDGGTVTKEPTETEKGVRTYKCSVCGYVMRTEVIEELPPSHTHSYGTDWKSDNSNHWHECDCGDRSGVSAHTEDGGSVTKAPTETEKGVRTYRCSVCGYVMRTEEIEELPPSHTHSYGTDWKSDSNIHWHECACGDRSGVSAHTEDGGSVTKAPTETEKGVRTYKCSVCGYVMRTEEIEKLPPSPGNGDDNSGSGSGDNSGQGSGTGTPTQGTKQPFIKGEDGKAGWDVIRTEEEQAQEGSIINVDMNGTTVVPGSIFDSIKGRDITITFDMGSGIIWSTDGKSVTTDKSGGIDFTVKTGVNAIPVDILNNVTGERYSVQISLAHEGEFGFTAVLSISLGKENAGYIASLYYYNQSAGELEFICADEVAEDGTVLLVFTHASDYVIAIDGSEEENGAVAEPAQQGNQNNNFTEAAAESPKTGQEKKNVLWPIVAGISSLVGIVFASMFAWKKKKEGGLVKEDK